MFQLRWHESNNEWTFVEYDLPEAQEYLSCIYRMSINQISCHVDMLISYLMRRSDIQWVMILGAMKVQYITLILGDDLGWNHHVQDGAPTSFYNPSKWPKIIGFHYRVCFTPYKRSFMGSLLTTGNGNSLLGDPWPWAGWSTMCAHGAALPRCRGEVGSGSLAPKKVCL